jgi:hypothetical protein
MSRPDVVKQVRQWADDTDAPESDAGPEQQVTPLAGDTEQLRDQLIMLRACQTTVEKWWPAMWPAVDAALSAITTLKLGGVDIGIALIYIGFSGVGKSKLCEFIGHELTNIVVWRDSFTTASLQGHSQVVDKKTLQDRS